MNPEYGIIREEVSDGVTLITIDTAKAKHQGLPWRTLGDFGKRKFENWLVLSRAKERLKIQYV